MPRKNQRQTCPQCRGDFTWIEKDAPKPSEAVELSCPLCGETLDGRLASQRDRLAEALREVQERHQPVTEEAECFTDDAGHDEFWPECGGGMDCAGHSRDVQVCSECGYCHDGDSPKYRTWPCPTYRTVCAALALLQEVEHG